MTFNKCSNITDHFRKHNKSQPFKCSYCGNKFTYKSNMIYHRRTQHTAEIARDEQIRENIESKNRIFDINKKDS